MPTMTDKELRFVDFDAVPPAKIEMRGDAGKQQAVLIGYGAVFNKRSSNLGGFFEVISPGAFDDILKSGQDVRALFNHDASMLLGRASSKTLRLTADSTGLRYEIDLPDTQLGRDVRELVNRGDLNGSSFSFSIAPNGAAWEDASEGTVRTVTKVSRLYDVGPVTFPAYPDTTVAIRSMTAKKQASKQAENKLKIMERGVAAV